jgi:hypothetical protein
VAPTSTTIDVQAIVDQVQQLVLAEIDADLAQLQTDFSTQIDYILSLLNASIISNSSTAVSCRYSIECRTVTLFIVDTNK